MKKHKSQKTAGIVRLLDEMRTLGNEVLTDVADIMQESVEFYDHCLASWDNPTRKFDGTAYSYEEIYRGQECCKAGLNMADSIVNRLRIRFLEPAREAAKAAILEAAQKGIRRR